MANRLGILAGKLFTDGFHEAFVAATRWTLARNADLVSVQDFINGAVVADEHAQTMMLRCNADPRHLATPLPDDAREGVANLLSDDELQSVLVAAANECSTLKHGAVSSAHVLIAALQAQAAPAAHQYFTSRGITVDHLRSALGALTIIGSGAAPRMESLRVLIASALTEDERQDRLDQLVSIQIGELMLREASAIASVQVHGRNRQRWLQHLVGVAELAGDANAVLRFGQDLVFESDKPVPHIHGSLARAYAHRGDTARAWDGLRQLAAAPTRFSPILAIEAAETCLLLGDPERSVDWLGGAPTLDVDAMSVWYLLVRAQQGRAGIGQPLTRDDLEPFLVTDRGGSLQWLTPRLRVEALHADLAAGSARPVAKRAKVLADEARTAGFGGVLCEALEVRSAALVAMGSRSATKQVAQAIAEAERLGRLVQAHRIGQLVH